MAGKNSGTNGAGGKSTCPTCGARSNNPNIGNDGQKRVAGVIRWPTYSESARSRARAAAIRAQNGKKG